VPVVPVVTLSGEGRGTLRAAGVTVVPVVTVSREDRKARTARRGHDDRAQRWLSLTVDKSCEMSATNSIVP